MSKFLTLEFLQHIEQIYQLGKQIHEDTIHRKRTTLDYRQTLLISKTQMCLPLS